MSLIASSGASGVASSAGAAGMLSYATPILMAGSSILGGLSKRRALKESSDAEYENAIAAKVRGYFEQRGLKLDQESLLSTIRNRAAGAGLDVTQGSPLEAYLQSARETQLDIVNAHNTADAEESEHKRRAAALSRAGDQALVGDILGGVGDLMSYSNKKGSVSFKKSDGKG